MELTTPDLEGRDHRPPARPGRPGTAERHLLVDALRGFAVLGIFWRNAFVLGMPYFAYSVPGLIDADTGPDRVAMVFVAVFAEGTMRALLSILFGASVLLALGVPSPDDPLAPVDRHFRRLLWLAVLGFAHAYLFLWPHDILFLYGMLGLGLFPFRHLASRALAAIGLALLMGSTVIGGTGWRAVGSAVGEMEVIEDEIGSGPTLPSEGFEDMMREAAPDGSFLEGRAGEASNGALGWIVPSTHAETIEGETAADPDGEDALSIEEFEMLAEAMASIEAETAARLSGYGDNFGALAPETFEQQTSELYTHHVFDIGAMLFIGMALLKGGVLTGEASPSTYRRLALGGLVGGAALGVLAHDGLIGIEALMPLSLAIGDYMFDARRLAFALGIVGAFGWLAIAAREAGEGRASGMGARLLRALAVPGRVALSLYVMQTAIGILVFYGFGLGLFGMLTHIELLAFALAVSAFQLWLAHAWTRRFGRGPLERVLVRLVDGPARA